MSPRDDIVLGQREADDIDSAVAVAVVAGLWDPADTAPVRTLLGAAAAPAAGGPIWVVAGPPGAVTGTACAQPVVGTDRTWDLTMIGVLPDSHRRGTGSVLLEAIESAVHEHGGRLLLVETSSSPAQDAGNELWEFETERADASPGGQHQRRRHLRRGAADLRSPPSRRARLGSPLR